MERMAQALWGLPTVVLLLAVGAVLTVRTRGFFLFHPHALLRELAHPARGGISPFAALCTALAGTLGTGNMAGTAAAIALGGPGAVLWMMVCALLGMTTKAAECALAVRYRRRDASGGFCGGAMYYMRDGLGGVWRGIASVFAAAMAVSALGTMAVQPAVLAQAAQQAFGVPQGVSAATAVALCAAVLFRGRGGAARACTVLMPALCTLYLGMSFWAIWVHRAALPQAVALIFTGAFSPRAAAGGLSGAAVRRAMSVGFSKSTFTHEAGMGSAPMVHAAADARCPAAQGLLGAAEVALDTLVICALTAFVILTAGEGVWRGAEPGIGITLAAFRRTFGAASDGLLAICIALFAFSTMIGWIFEFETCAAWLFGPHPTLCRIVYLLPPLFVVGMGAGELWALVDVCTGIVTVPNAVALLLLGGAFAETVREYRAP